MNIKIYTAILYLALPFVFLRLLWRSRKNPAYRDNWRQRLGHCDTTLGDKVIWIHAVSVGETQAAEPLVKKLQNVFPTHQILITTTTPTGTDRVRKLYGDTVAHSYFPFDLPFAVERFLDQVNPVLLLMMETEVWPNLLAESSLRGIPTLLANARMSEKSAKGYASLGKLAKETFSYIDQVAAQSEDDAQRFIDLGVHPDRVQVIGSLKFEVKLPASLLEQAEVLRRAVCSSRPAWVAASTRDGEEKAVLMAHRQVLKKMPDALLILVPRHPERFNKVAQLCKRKKFTVARRSEGQDCHPQTQVYLGDTMGELSLFLAVADAAFVGGSLVKLGGQNILEPAALGVPIAFGPHMFNFAEISRMFLQRGAAVQVDGAAKLGEVMSNWLYDAGERTRFGEQGRQLIEENRGATQRLIELVTAAVPEES